jgi:hypothetical protein
VRAGLSQQGADIAHRLQQEQEAQARASGPRQDPAAPRAAGRRDESR